MTAHPDDSVDGSPDQIGDPPTGDPRVDAALIRLADVAHSPVDEHVSIYDDVHRRLQHALTDLDGS